MGAYEWEEFYRTEEQIEFATERKKNSLRGDSFIDGVAKKQNRKQVEVKISQITSRLGNKIHAVTVAGFQFKVFLLILAFALIKYVIL